ncbi:MAG: IS481 family transposase [Betaproteobacteria bacterium]|nr:IS481 family transposase [Betaproteobacteria bacterium]
MEKALQQRQVRRRISVIKHASQTTQNVAKTCRYYGISRKTFYKWVRRYEEQGESGLCDQSKRPIHFPRETSKEVVSKVLYHWKRYEKQQPGLRVQVDVKFLERIAGSKKRFYQFTAIDDCTRIRVLKIYDRCNQTTAIDFIDEVRRRLPFRILVVQTDNGAEFQSKFHWHLQDLDIGHSYIRPHTPRLNGKVERSHRIDAQEFYQLLDKRGVSDDIQLFNKKLKEWENFYNFQRPHGALDGQTPYERLKQKTSLAM